MRARDAPPEATGDGSGRGLSRTGNAGSVAEIGLPAHLLERLALNEVSTLADWQALGRKRFKLWGLPRSAVAEIDAAVDAALVRP